ncbi:MAG: YfgM family protein [Gammaproteobacteria bacterium]
MAEGYGTDSEQIEALRSWWAKNGRYVVAGLVVAAIVIGVWRGWDWWEAKKAGAAAELYAPVVIAEQKSDSAGVANAARAVIGEYSGTAYGALAGLALAKAEFSRHHFIKAEQALRSVIANSPDQGFATIARLRLASIELQRGDAGAVLTTLDKTKIPAAFVASADTLRGEAFRTLGRNADARAAWQHAMAASDPTSGRYRLLEMRLGNLPATSTAPAKPAAKASASAKPAAGKAPAANASTAKAGVAGTGAKGASR